MIKVTRKAAEKFKADLRAESLPENTMLRIDGKHGEEEKDMQLALFFERPPRTHWDTRTELHGVVLS